MHGTALHACCLSISILAGCSLASGPLLYHCCCSASKHSSTIMQLASPCQGIALLRFLAQCCCAMLCHAVPC
jgi:hypothetical protein